MHFEIWLKQLIVTNFPICHDKLVNQQCTARSGLPQDDESSRVQWFLDHNNLEWLHNNLEWLHNFKAVQ